MNYFSGITDVQAYHNPNEGRVIINENFRKMISGVTESSDSISITYADLSTSIQLSALSPNSVYYISDGGIWLTSISESEISIDGFRNMPIVNNSYYIPSSGVMGTFGTYYPSPPTIGDVTVWGGSVWVNLSGNTGASIDASTLDSEWEKIPNTNSTYYVEKIFKIKYDFENNWVFQQEDDRYNIFGNSFELSGINYCDISDWGSELVVNNKCAGVFNNIYSGFTAYIRDNVTSGVISSNYGLSITSNSVKGDISSNSIYRIEQMGSISKNYILYSITGNGITYSIENNSNQGDIIDNITDYIYFNNNKGSIKNSRGSIIYNSNAGDINYSSTAIRNSNVGHILGENSLNLCYAQYNSDRSGPITGADIGGGNKILKSYRDQAYLSYIPTGNIFQELIGDAFYIDVDSFVINGVLHLDFISNSFSTLIQSSIKNIYLFSTTNTQTTITTIVGMSVYNDIKFCFTDTEILFSANTTGDYAYGNIIHKLDYTGGTRNFTFGGLGDFIEYSYTSYPNVGYFNPATPGLPINSTIYGVVNEINSANYNIFPSTIALSFVYFYVNNSDLNIDTSDTLAWMVRGIVGATSHSTIEWTNTLSAPMILNFPADLPPNSTVQQGSYTINGDDRAIDGIYTITVYNDDTMESITQ